MPDHLGPYEVRGLIHAGGMGIVYLGWDGRLDRHVAVKTLAPGLAGEEEARRRFLREARAAAALSHPHLTPIYDIGEEEGCVFYAMEFLAGPSLADLIRQEGRLDPARAVNLVRQVASGLQAAAGRGIVHRDIKPANLIFAADGTLKVSDFGLAKESLSSATLTVSGQLLGTPHYMAPEQAVKGEADTRSDIYSLGATFFEMVTGAPPYQADTSMAVILKHLHDPVPSPREMVQGLSPSLDSLIRRMLRKNPEGRPQDYAMLLSEIEKVEAAGFPSTSPVAGGRLGPPGTSGRATVALPQPPSSGRSEKPSSVAGRAPKAAGSRRWVLPVAAVTALLAALWLAGRTESPEGKMLQINGREKESLALRGEEPVLQTGDLDRGGDPLLRDRAPDQELEAAAGDGPVRAHPVPFSRRRARRLATMMERLAQRRQRASGKTGPPEPRPRAALEVAQQSHQVTADGHLVIEGRVVNHGRARSTGSRVRVTLRSADGVVVDSKVTPVHPARLGPGETGDFQVRFADPGRRVQFELELTWLS